jgi:hypothetical protein
MKQDDRPADSAELEALLERGRIIGPVPDVVRARVLARARATAAAASAVAPEQGVPRRAWRLSLAVAASLALLAGVAGGAAALVGRRWNRPEPMVPSAEPLIQRAPISVPKHSATPTVEPEPTVAREPDSIAKSRRTGHPVTPQESYAAELRLLQRAQAAYAGRDFPGALALVSEHDRRFPNGRLAEEREALRVRSLAASGHRDEARRSAAAFANRFPRSVHLPRLAEAVRNAE